MNTLPADPERQRKLYAEIQVLLGPVVGGAIGELAAVADFELSAEAARPFVEFVHWVNARPAFIALWRNDSAAGTWHYLRFMKVADDARSAYAAACYHLGRIKQIEATVNVVLSRYDFTNQIPPNSASGIGRMRQLDFEYHAFVLAYRRCLDYLAWGLSIYFKQKQDSFNKLRKTLASSHPKDVAAALVAAYDRHSPKFKFVMGEERGKSLRDRISHSEFVPAAGISVDANGHRFVGGGEKLRRVDPTDERSFSEILEGRANDLHACISDFLATFRAAVVEFEAANPS